MLSNQALRICINTTIYRIVGLFAIIVVSVALGGLIGLYRQPPGLQWAMQTLGLEPGGGTSSPIAVPVHRPASTKAPSIEKDIVVALGRLVPKGEVLTLATASGVRDARVQKLKVREGDKVRSGQILAVLDNEARLKATVAAARSTVELREASLAQTRASTLASRRESQAALARAQATALQARQDYERTKGLFNRRVVSKSTYDQKLTTARAADEEVVRLAATLSRYGEGDINQQPDVLVAARSVAAAKAELLRTTEDLDQAYVKAPIAGTVLEIHTRPGEKPGEDGVLEIGNIARMTAKVEIYQSQIGQIAKDDPVTISASALPDKLSGTISRIGLQVKKQTVTGSDPAANTDARVIEVIVALDETSSEIASRFTNLQIEARIQPGAGQ